MHFPPLVITLLALPMMAFGCWGPKADSAVGDPATPSLDDVRTVVMEYIQPRPDSAEVWPLNPEEGVFLATYEWTPAWTGGFIVFGFTGRQVSWTADVADPPQEQSIHRARIVRADGHEGPLIEIIGLSHMGNGRVYVYRLDEHSLTLLLKVTVLDQHDDGQLFAPPHHQILYVDRNADSIADIEISGELIVTVSDPDAPSSRPKVTQISDTYLWNPSAGRFVRTVDEESSGL